MSLSNARVRLINTTHCYVAILFLSLYHHLHDNVIVFETGMWLAEAHYRPDVFGEEHGTVASHQFVPLDR